MLSLKTDEPTRWFEGTEFEYSPGDSGMFVSIGDEIVLSHDTTSDGGRAFDWGSVDAADIVLKINNVTLPVSLGIVGSVVKISATISSIVVPCSSCKVSVHVAPFGNAVVLHSTVHIVPVI